MHDRVVGVSDASSPVPSRAAASPGLHNKNTVPSWADATSMLAALSAGAHRVRLAQEPQPLAFQQSSLPAANARERSPVMAPAVKIFD